ncbi:DNA-binding repressor [Rahnella aquatilis CIP 78.65 = ATCC 33071]|uniref:Putative transcriptional regulator n=1 Tax=Rahnella aquatilis (strain ATCC 33071 / DSM 4594 / JCM 1683 / NBRC 105701 / NCIMB 13365 / CIP 78.65) TaxID=745277 RepID=H2IY65_RAHAC|nr:helix-turn-helix domain-containing protein [Rahnella aquatilis]AEX53142.1 putative transcriptional regulator [Rahnella aquatilis CIP 78.65 = ATCC 33071]KFD04022.1 DNA-binding repressor [Rahnella aquatilis CIP 78.65 = ATCC 33071]
MDLSEKIKAIRTAEELSQSKFCEIMEMSISTLKKYEGGHAEPGGAVLVKITQHPRFEKYALWLMTGKTSEAAGQISPALSPDGQNEISNRQNGQKAG